MLNPKSAHGTLTAETIEALSFYQRRRRIPDTGQADATTLTALGVAPSGNERDDVRAAQRALLRIRREMGRVRATQNLDPETERALRVFQQTVGLPVTGLPDEATRDRLAIGDAEGYTPLNIGSVFRRLGIDVTMVFTDESHFGVAEDWIRALFDRLSKGKTLFDAARAATSVVPRNQRSDYDYRLHANVENPGLLKILPARHGANP